jgi:hypothetical protein
MAKPPYGLKLIADFPNLRSFVNDLKNGFIPTIEDELSANSFRLSTLRLLPSY